MDFLNREISKYITAAASYERTKKGSRIYNALFSITGNIERISDHAMNIAQVVLNEHRTEKNYHDEQILDIE